MDEFRLKDNEIMCFFDFNNTLVSFETEYDNSGLFYEDAYSMSSWQTLKFNLNKCLTEFETKTGLTPVICVVTNARSDVVDRSGYEGIFNDLYMSFLNTNIPTDAERFEWFKNHSINRFFKYLVYKDNDHFYKINGFSHDKKKVFERVDFNSKAMSIMMIPEHRKKENVARIMSLVDPEMRSKYLFFAGDEIKDDYPMTQVETPRATSKIYVNTGKIKKMTPDVMRRFAAAKGGVVFSLKDTKTGKIIKILDNNNIHHLSQEEQEKILNYSDGVTILLSPKDTRGLIKGIYEASDIIKKDMIAKNGETKNNQFGG